MTTTHELQPLLDRVRAATGPDRELDEALMALFYVRDERHIGCFMENDMGRDEPVKDSVWVDPVTDKWVSTHAHPVTASIDAAFALTERVLPGWVVADLSQNSRHAGDPWGCKLALYHGGDSSKNRFSASGSDFTKPQFAIIAAALTALIARTSA